MIEKDLPRLIYSGTHSLYPLGTFPDAEVHCFVAADFRFWVQKETEVREWLQENMQEEWNWQGSVFSFRSEKDAILFKLTWG